ncbi:MAG: hypothetical protein KAH38_00935 [Candidatus Hydrogenedentes bacterium]|nr:hypothetical protein [Candidatus Hydrogenedentota bacterium]
MNEKIRVEVYTCSNSEIDDLEYEVYLDAGYIESNDAHRVLENDNYPDQHVVAVYSDDVLAGSVRLVMDSRPRETLFSLGCLDHFNIWPWAEKIIREVPQKQLMQVGTTVIREGHRGGAVFQAMFSKSLEIWLREQIHLSVTTIDEDFLGRLNRRKVSFIPMGDTVHYMGSRTVPIFVSRDWLMGGTIPKDILALSAQYSDKKQVAVHSA